MTPDPRLRPVELDSLGLRSVAGDFATGVTVVTSLGSAEGGGIEKVGMSVNTFTSVSLDPLLILISLANLSATGNRIRQAGFFAINVISEGQEDVSHQFATRTENRFEGVETVEGVTGAPILVDASTAAVECEIENEIPAGDHTIVVGGVAALHRISTDDPLLFYRGGYHSVHRR